MIAFSIWNFHIYWYGIFYLIWFLIAYFFLKRIWSKKFLAKEKMVQQILEFSLEDLLIYLVLWVIIWWRLWEVFIYQWDYFSNNLLEIFAIWHGGMSFFWWMIGVLISVFIFSKVHKLSIRDILILLSLIIVVLPLGIMLWRFGNYLNQELYGIVIPQSFLSSHITLTEILSKFNIFHVYNSVDGNLRLNTNFLAIFFEWLIPFIILMFLFVRQLKVKCLNPYLNVGIFGIVYCIARFFLEYFRVGSQSQFVWLFTKSQRLFSLLFFVWVYLICVSKNRKIEM